jgi:hypothetical protein
MAFEHSQGTTVVWDGVTVLALVSCDIDTGDTGMVDITPVNAPVIGAGSPNPRVLRQQTPATIEPARVSIVCRGWGIAVQQNDRGMIAPLSVTGPNFSYSGNAALVSTDVSAAVGELIVQRVEWVFV